MTTKYDNILLNVSSGFDALCGPSGLDSRVRDSLRAKARAAYAAAGVDVDDASRRPRQISDHYGPPTAARATEPLGSSWQSLKSRTGTVETDYLNGRTVMLGRRFGAPTPANWAVQTARIRGSSGQASGSRRGEGFADSGSGRSSWIGGRRTQFVYVPLEFRVVLLRGHGVLVMADDIVEAFPRLPHWERRAHLAWGYAACRIDVGQRRSCDTRRSPVIR
jgi:hypothetical protein